MKSILLLGITFFFSFYHGWSQYTNTINSNRPGASYSAFSVGTGVIQGENGFFYEQRDHSGLRTEASRLGLDYVFRYGLLLEELELIIDGSAAYEQVTDNSTLPGAEYDRSNFLKNTVGVKYLIYDPFKKEGRDQPNLYSWNANNGFQWKNLVPAIAVYAGANFNFGDNPFLPPAEPTVSPKVMLITQHELMPRWVLVSNLIYDKFTGDDPMINYIITLTHSLRNGRFSLFAEHQGYKSDFYGDGVFRIGAAHLLNKNLQVDISGGTNIKDTPRRIFGEVGIAYRLDYHKDPKKKIDNVSDFEKRALRKKKKKRKKRF
ncbi:transporter [Robertkochia sediminum]|uniref:transporter n=1 Tax=Robertkochia sediminum TaxID=2785326 RepID=UPI0019316353|nr:transporter [Robertkochia sediminum]MBL7473443.1 transporter [Robertkochia sediminum]